MLLEEEEAKLLDKERLKTDIVLASIP